MSEQQAAPVKKGIQAVAIACEVLRVLARARGPLALKHIARQAGLSPSQAHNYVSSLVTQGMLKPAEQAGHYQLGSLSLQLGLAAMEELDVLALCRPAIRTLRDETGATVFVSLWGNHGPAIVHWLEGTSAVTVELRAGSVMPVTQSATGQMFAACLPRSRSEALVHRELEEKDDHIEAFYRSLVTTEKRNMAINDGGLLPGVAGLSAGIFDHQGRISAVITLIARRGSIGLEPADTAYQTLAKHCKALSAQLGYRACNGYIERG